MSKLTGLSLFSNVGIAEAYLKEIGVDIVLANELLEERAKFYADVYTDTKMVCGDITDDGVRGGIIAEAIEKKVISWDEKITVSPGPIEIFLCILDAIRLSAAIDSPWLPVVIITVFSSG